MLSVLEALAGYVSVPTWVIVILLFLFLVMQVIGEVMEFCGKMAPGFMKVRKRWKEKREEETRRAEQEKRRDEMLAAAAQALESNNQ